MISGVRVGCVTTGGLFVNGGNSSTTCTTGCADCCATGCELGFAD